MSIYNDEGDIIECITDDALCQYFEKPYQELYSLYEIARRQALGVEKALDEMLSELPKISKDNSLIEKKKQKDSLRPPFPSEYDDVPF